MVLQKSFLQKKSTFTFFVVFFLMSLAYAGQVNNSINFKPYVVIATGSSPRVCTNLQIRNLPYPEMLVVGTGYSNDENDYSLFIINASTGIVAQYKYPISYPGLNAIKSADFNNDDWQDFVIAYGDSFKFYYQSQYSIYSSPGIYSGKDIDAVTVVKKINNNVNGLITGHWNEDIINAYYQNQSGLFSLFQQINHQRAGYDAMATLDNNNFIHMRGQGLLPPLNIYNQDSDGFFSLSNSFEFNSNYSFNDVTAGDVDGNGLDDIVTVFTDYNNPRHYRLGIQKQLSSGVFSDIELYETYNSPEVVLLADFDLDNDLDIGIVHGGYTTFSVFENLGNGTYNQNYLSFIIPYASHYKPDGACVILWNDDLYPDIAIADYNHGVVILENSSNLLLNNKLIDQKDNFFLQNYPNPFNPATTIAFNLPTNEIVKLIVYDNLGREVIRLIDNKKMQSGRHEVIFNGHNFASGVYYYKLIVDNHVIVKKMKLLK